MPTNLVDVLLKQHETVSKFPRSPPCVNEHVPARGRLGGTGGCCSSQGHTQSAEGASRNSDYGPAMISR
jgi:hypothetical protein